MTDIIATIETDFSKVTSAIVGAFKSSPATATVATDLSTSLAAAEAAIPQLADAGLSAAMALLGTEGAAFTPLAVSFLNSLITKAEALVASKSA